MMNVGVSVKNQMIEVIVKMIICVMLVRVIASVIRPAKLINIQMLRRYCLFGKLVLACEDEILNTTENVLNDKKTTCQKK